MFLGYALAFGGDGRSAADLLRQGVLVYERLVTEFPRSHPHRYALALGLFAQARLDQSAGRAGPAEPKLTRALGLIATLTEEQPGVEHYALLARQCRFALGQVLQSLDRLDDAQDLMAQAIAVARRQWQAQPQVPLHAAELADYLIARSQLLAKLDRHTESLRELDEALGLLEGPLGDARGTEAERTRVRLLRAGAVVRGGNYRAGVAEAERALAGQEPRGPNAYHLACVYALAAVAVRSDERLPAERKGEEARKFADRAVRLLEVAFPYIHQGSLAQTLRGERDLLGLHDRPDFRRLLARLQTRPATPPIPFLIPLP
jgi:tetratricopeptide (TPR) repeat protein